MFNRTHPLSGAESNDGPTTQFSKIPMNASRTLYSRPVAYLEFCCPRFIYFSVGIDNSLHRKLYDVPIQ